MSDFERLGLKTGYDFKQVRIPIVEDRGGIKDEAARLGTSHRHTPRFDQLAVLQSVRQRVMPAILGLEAKGVINGFYFLIRGYDPSRMELGLSCDSWGEKEPDIKKVLEENGINDELMRHSGSKNGRTLDLEYNALEWHSRSVLAYISILDTGTDEERRKIYAKVPKAWIDSIYNQFGYLDLAQSVFEFDSGFYRLNKALNENQCTIEESVRFLRYQRERADKAIRALEKGGTDFSEVLDLIPD
jgi:hypothetical protein